MLIDLQYLIDQYQLKINGVIHLGASVGQEMLAYRRCGIENIYWVEAIPVIYDKLCVNLMSFTGAKALNYCISDVDGKVVNFNITNNNGESSSLFNLKKHKFYYPHIEVVETIKLTTITLDTLIIKERINIPGEVNLLVMDLQGAELLALKGGSKNLSGFDGIYLEFSEEELYEDGAKVEDLDLLLYTYKFSPVVVSHTGHGWGDKFYINLNRYKPSKA
jgi:FkbM family methyltransferase